MYKEVKIAGMLSQAKEHMEVSEPGGNKEGFSPRGLRGRLCRHHGYRLLASRTVREYVSIVLSCPVCGNLGEQPYETNTVARLKRMQENSVIKINYILR